MGKGRRLVSSCCLFLKNEYFLNHISNSTTSTERSPFLRQPQQCSSSSAAAADHPFIYYYDYFRAFCIKNVYVTLEEGDAAASSVQPQFCRLYSSIFSFSFSLIACTWHIPLPPSLPHILFLVLLTAMGQKQPLVSTRFECQVMQHK